MLKLKLQYCCHLMWRLTHLKRPLCWERLKSGGEGGDRGWNDWIASPTQWTWVWVCSGVGDGQGSLACCSLWGCKESDTTEWLNWTELKLRGQNTTGHSGFCPWPTIYFSPVVGGWYIVPVSGCIINEVRKVKEHHLTWLLGDVNWVPDA